MKYFKLIFRNLRRNRLRSMLTALVTMVLVLVVTMAWSVLWLLDLVTAEKSQNFQAMVADRWAVPSRLPYAYSEPISRGAARKPDDVRPLDSMTWQFFIGTLDLKKLTRENMVFAIACEPDKIGTMLDGLNDLPPNEQKQLFADIAKLKATRQGIILGNNHILNTNKRVGDFQEHHAQISLAPRMLLMVLPLVGVQCVDEIVAVEGGQRVVAARRKAADDFELQVEA